MPVQASADHRKSAASILVLNGCGLDHLSEAAKARFLPRPICGHIRQNTHDQDAAGPWARGQIWFETSQFFKNINIGIDFLLWQMVAILL